MTQPHAHMALAATAHTAARRVLRSRGTRLVVAAGIVCSGLALPAVSQTTPACSASREGRRLDFWVGHWTVTAPGGQNGSVSTVSLSLDKCLLTERWDGGKGHLGENVFAYSPDDHAWHAMFIDNQARVHALTGKVAAGAADFSGPSVGPTGQRVLNRIRIIRVSDDRVEQSWEKSADDGVTWTMEFRGNYSRTKP